MYMRVSECRVTKSELIVVVSHLPPPNDRPYNKIRTTMRGIYLVYIMLVHNLYRKQIKKTHQSCTLLKDSSFVMSYISMNPIAPL